MPLSTRELLLTLRARDEASKVVRGLSREVLGMGTAIEAASARASAAALRQQAASIRSAAAIEAAELRNNATLLRQEATALRNAAVVEAAEARKAAAIMRSQLATLKQTGATKDQIDTLRQAINDADNHAKRVVDNARVTSVALREQAAQYDNNARSIINNARVSAVAITDQAKAIDNQIRSTQLAAKQMELFIGRMQQVGQVSMTAGASLVIAGASVLYGLYQTTQAAADYAKQVKLTKTQVDGFSTSLEDLARIGLRVARSVSVPFEEIQPALYDIFSSTNANLRESEVLLTAFAKAAVAGQVSIQDASRETISVMNAFNIPFKDVNKVLDVQFQLVRKGVGTYAEFSKVIGNVIPAATRSGQTFEMVGAMLAYLTRNGLSTSAAATSAARALEAMSHPKTVERLKAMGIAAYDARGNMRPLTDILVDLRKKLEEVPKPERIKMLVDLLKSAGGTIQARRFLEQVLLRPEELEEFIGYLNDMKNSSGEFGDAYNTMANSVSSKTQLLRNQWEALKVQAGEALTPMLSKLLDILLRLFAWFDSLPSSVQNNIIIFTAFAAILTVVSGILFIIVGTIAMVVAAVAAAGTGFISVIAIIASAVVALVALGASLYALYERSETVKGVVQSLRSYFSSLRDAVSEAFQKVKEAYEEHLEPAFTRLWDVVENKVLPVVKAIIDLIRDELIPKVREAGRIIGDEFAILMEYAADIITNAIIPALEDMSNWWKENKDRLEPYLDVLGTFIKIVLVVAALIVGAFIAAILALIAAVALIVAAFFKAISAISSFIDWIKSSISSVGKFKDSVSAHMNSAISVISSLPGRASAALGNLSSTLWSAGKSLVQGFINGIQSMFSSVQNKLSQLTAMLPDWKGPKPTDARILRPAGQTVIRGFMKGIDDVRPELERQMRAITTDIGMFEIKTTTPLLPPTTPYGDDTFAGGTVINQTFNITTQEINPTRHAADLGFLLAGR